MKMAHSEWIKPFNVYILNTNTESGNNQIPVGQGWTDNLNIKTREQQT